ncbi:hypothetical protein Gpo141_00005110 [Globisporangium polare]
MVRFARWTLLLIAATCASAATDKQTQQDKTCIAPSVVAGFEQKIATLEDSNADVAARLDLATSEWKAERKALDDKYTKEHTDHLSTVTLLRKTKAKSDETVAVLEKKLEKAENKHREQLQSLDAQVQVLEETVGGLKKDLAAQKELVHTRDSEVSHARERLAQYAAKVKTLEKDVQLSRKSNEALRSELESKETEISLSALLSSYYDEGVVVAATTVAALREQAEQSSGTLNKVVDTLESTKKTVVDTTDKFYAENLAATVDPILADIRVAADPHVKKYLPIVQSEAEKAKAEAIKLSQEGLKRAKSARLEAIALLEQNENVRSHAQKIVDGVLVAIGVPLALLQFRFLLRVVWWLFTTAICVFTFGCCCGRKRKVSSRKSSARKSTSSPVLIPGSAASAVGSAQKKKQAAGANSASAPSLSANKCAAGGKKSTR